MTRALKELDADSIRILLIERNPGNTHWIQEMLAVFGTSPRQAAGGKLFNLECAGLLSDGLARLAAGGVDIVLLDTLLPDCEGVDALTRLKAQAPDLPIIVLTNLEGEDLAVAALQAGAKDYLIREQADGNQLARAIRYAVERRRSEELLSQEKQKLEDVTRYVNCGLLLLNAQGKITYANDLAQEWFGPLAQIIGKDCREAYKVPEAECGASKVLQSGETDQAILFTHTRAGEEKYFQVVSSPVKDSAGRIQQVTQVLVDITASKLAEMALEQRTRELSVLYMIDQAVSQSLDLDEVLDASLGKVLQALDAEAGAIYLCYDDGSLRLHTQIGLSDVLVQFFNVLEMSKQGFLQDLIAQKMVRTDIAEYIPAEALPLVAKNGLQSLAAVPLVAKERALGILGLASREPRVFAQDQLNFLTSIGQQLSSAMENARLFGETRDARDAVLNMLEDLEETAGQLRLKSERLAVLNELDRVISSSFNLEEVYRPFVELAARLISFDHTSIILLDATGESWNTISFWSRDETGSPVGAQLPVKGSVMEFLLSTRRVWQENDISERSEYLENEFLRQRGARSRIYLPLVVRDRVIGALTFGSNQPGAYSERNLEILTPLADQMAIAVENARLYTAQQRRAARLKVISDAGQQIASILDQQELLHQVVTLLAERFGYYYASILLVDPEADEIVLKANSGQIYVALESYRFKIGQDGITGWVAESARPLLVNDVTREFRYSFVEVLKDTRSELAVPILVKGQVIGVLDVQSTELNAFDKEDLFTLQALAEQTAVALDNAHLYELEHQARQVAETLHDSTASLTGSLDPDQVLERILVAMQRVIPHDAANIALVDGDIGHFVRWRGYEQFGMGPGVPGPVFSVASTPYFRLMAETGQPMITGEVSHDPRWVRYPGMEWLHSYIGAPIIVRDQLIGFLNLDSATPGFFELGHSRLLQTFAHQVGAVIENARLYQKVLASEQEYRTLVENATELIWTLDIEGRFTFVNRVTEEVGGRKIEDWLGQSFAALTVPEDLSYSQRIFAETLAGKKQSFETRVYHPGGRLLYLSINTAPLHRGNEIVGTISFGRDVTAQKQAEAALQRRMTELTALFEVSTALRGAETLEAMLPIILKKTVKVAQADTGALFRRDESTDELVAQAAQGQLEGLLGIRFAPAEGVCGYVAQTRTPYPFADLASDPHTGDRVALLVRGVQGGICVPMLTSEQLVGTLIIGSEGRRVFSDDEIRLLMTIADMAAAAIRRTGLFEELQRRVHGLSTLFDVGSAITSSLHVEDVVNLVAQASSRALQAEACTLFLWDEQEQCLVMRAVSGAAPDLVGRVKYHSGEGLVGHVFLERRPANVPDVATDPRWKRESEQENTLPGGRIANVAIVPLVVGEKVLGTLGVANKIGALAFSAEDQSLLTTLASQVAVAIENAHLYEDMRHLSVAAIRSLAAAIDARDPYTHGHSEGVARLAIQLARQMGWSGVDLETIEFAALLHDVGKIAVPDAILRKTDPLTAEDWDIIRRHPYYSAQIVKPIEPLQDIIPWIYHHHEHWNGAGYPDGLKGEAIPLGARVITVADAFDAMTTDRPYHEAVGTADALAKIESCADLQFDPQIVKVFLKMMRG